MSSSIHRKPRTEGRQMLEIQPDQYVLTPEEIEVPPKPLSTAKKFWLIVVVATVLWVGFYYAVKWMMS